MEDVAPLAADGAAAASMVNDADVDVRQLANMEMARVERGIRDRCRGLRVSFGMKADGVAYCAVSAGVAQVVWTVSTK